MSEEKPTADELPKCPEGCTNMRPPYCHCQDCGETGVQLDDDGYCPKCADEA
jgi:hypothetical protein